MADKPTIPDKAPRDVTGFVDCTGADLEIKVGTVINWIPNFPDVTVSDIKVTGDKVTLTGSALEGFVKVTANLTVTDGKLDAQLEGLTDYVAGNAVGDWTTSLNDWLASNKKKLDKPTYDAKKKALKVHKSDAAAAAPKAAAAPGVKAAPKGLKFDAARLESEQQQIIPQPVGNIAFSPTASIDEPPDTTFISDEGIVAGDSRDIPGDAVVLEADDEDNDVAVTGPGCFTHVSYTVAVLIIAAVVILGGVIAIVYNNSGGKHTSSVGTQHTTQTDDTGSKATDETGSGPTQSPFQAQIAGITNSDLRNAFIKATAEKELSTIPALKRTRSTCSTSARCSRTPARRRAITFRRRKSRTISFPSARSPSMPSAVRAPGA